MAMKFIIKMHHQEVFIHHKKIFSLHHFYGSQEHKNFSIVVKYLQQNISFEDALRQKRYLPQDYKLFFMDP